MCRNGGININVWRGCTQWRGWLALLWRGVAISINNILAGGVICVAGCTWLLLLAWLAWLLLFNGGYYSIIIYYYSISSFVADLFVYFYV